MSRDILLAIEVEVLEALQALSPENHVWYSAERVAEHMEKPVAEVRLWLDALALQGLLFRTPDTIPCYYLIQEGATRAALETQRDPGRHAWA